MNERSKTIVTIMCIAMFTLPMIGWEFLKTNIRILHHIAIILMIPIPFVIFVLLLMIMVGKNINDIFRK